MATLSCTGCFSRIENRKSYRNLRSGDFEQIFRCLGTKLDIVCNRCFGKLSKLNNYETKIMSTLEKMKTVKEKLTSDIMQLPGVTSARSFTPVAYKETQASWYTTEGMPESKRFCFSQPKQSGSQTPPAVVKNTFIDQSTQTESSTPDFKVKIIVKYGIRERSKIITDDIEQAVVKAFLNNSTHTAVLKCLAKSDKHKIAIISRTRKALQDEVKCIRKQHGSLLQVSSNDDLMNFDWKAIHDTMKQKLPTLIGVLEFFCEKRKVPNIPLFVTSVSMLLYGQNHKLNLLQFVLGIVLHSCGLREEGLHILHTIGLCVSDIDILLMKQRLLRTEEDGLNSVVDEQSMESTDDFSNEDTDTGSTSEVESPCKTQTTDESYGDCLLSPVEPCSVQCQGETMQYHYQ